MNRGITFGMTKVKLCLAVH